MSKNITYSAFSEDYDRFVDWESRLAVEIPFLAEELNALKPHFGDKVRVLDTACGTGQHLIALARLGFSCAGTDLSQGMVAKARQNITSAGLQFPIYRVGFGDLNDVFERENFDALLCLGNSLPHVLTPAELDITLRDFHAVLRPGGRLIVQMRNFNPILSSHDRWMPPQTYKEGDRTWIFIRFYDFDPDDRITFNILVLDNSGGKAFKQHLISTRLWPMSSGIVVEAVSKAGFERVKLFGDLQGSDYVPEQSGNLVLTADRK